MSETSSASRSASVAPSYSFSTASGSDPITSEEDSLLESNIDPSLRTPSVVVGTTPVVVDVIVKEFDLSDARRKDLKGLHQICTNPAAPMPPTQVLAMVYLLGGVFASEKRIKDSQGPVNEGNTVNVQELLQELSIRLEDTWALTGEQRANIKMVCREQIYKAGRFRFKHLHNDVNARMKQRPDHYRVGNIFGRSKRERELMRVIKSTLSNVRNWFRQELAASLVGAKRCSAQQFTNEIVARYNFTEYSSSQAILIQYTLLRRFALETGNLLLEGGDEDDNISGAESDKERPAKRKKKSKGRGRVAEGEDFWGRMDALFQEKTEEWGEDYNHPGWKSFIDESIRMDNEASKPKKKQNVSANVNTQTSWGGTPGSAQTGAPFASTSASATGDWWATITK